MSTGAQLTLVHPILNAIFTYLKVNLFHLQIINDTGSQLYLSTPGTPELIQLSGRLAQNVNLILAFNNISFGEICPLKVPKFLIWSLGL